jgi:NAD-dependent DNA ligase
MHETDKSVSSDPSQKSANYQCESEVCPICQDPLKSDIVVLTCGHQLCCPWYETNALSHTQLKMPL